MIGQNIYDPPYPPRQTAGLAADTAAEGIVCHFLAPTRFPPGRCFYMPLWPRWMGRAPKGGYTPVRIRLAAPMGEPGTEESGREGLGTYSERRAA